MKSKTIRSRDGSLVTRTDKGSLWFSKGRSASSFGAMYGSTCNIYKAETIGGKDYKGIPVHKKILRFADRLGIRKLRIIKTISKMGKYGWVQSFKYGYISSSKFERLLRRRKTIKGWENEFLILKDSDFKWRSE